MTMKKQVEIYLSNRRRLGFQLKIEGQELFAFAKYANKKGHKGHLTAAIAIEWASSSKKSSRLSWARRLEIIRCFAKYYYAFDPKTQIPPNHIFGSAHRRNTPYIYSMKEINHILKESLQLHSQYVLRPITYHYLFGLLACSGLRISEAVRLKNNDVDFTNSILTIRETKFYKSRYVPLHSTTIKALQEYTAIRDKKTCSQSDAFFVLNDKLPVTTRKARYAFQIIRKKLGLNKSYKGRKPRIYDLRHTFVCHRLLAWYKEGKNIDQAIPFLSTYLGHVKVSDTYWYITGIPELMSIATKRFEQPYQPII
jgi:integrase/recombinase XerD